MLCFLIVAIFSTKLRTMEAQATTKFIKYSVVGWKYSILSKVLIIVLYKYCATQCGGAASSLCVQLNVNFFLPKSMIFTSYVQVATLQVQLQTYKHLMSTFSKDALISTFK